MVTTEHAQAVSCTFSETVVSMEVDSGIFVVSGEGLFGIMITAMKNYTAVVEHCTETDLYVGYVPGFPGAHSQGATLDELKENLQEVITMLLEEGEPQLEAEFIGTQNLVLA